MDVRLRRVLSLVFVVLATMGIAVPTTQAAAPAELCTTQGAGVVPVTDRCDNKTYAEWAAQFWKFALAEPQGPTSPLIDPSGATCQLGQSDAVFFLPGTFDGSAATRSCTVPAGKPLFLPVINIIDVSTPPGFCTRIAGLADAGAVCEAESPFKLLSDIKPVEDAATGLFATIDGKAVPNVASFRVHTSAFSLSLPSGNLFGVLPRQSYMAVADGYYLLVAPLPVGQHTITFGGSTPGFNQDNTYTLTVAAQ